MKILQYNILDGCRNKERYGELTTWMKKKDYDVAGFNEMNDWTDAEFQEEMEKLGLLHTSLFVMESSRFHIGIASKFPIEKFAAFEEQPFHHGLLHVKINGIHFLITHFSPFESEYREREAEEVAEYIRKIGEPALLMGDLNTLSPLDASHYQKINELDRIMAAPFLVRQHLKGGEINYRPMQTLLDAGLHDILVRPFSYSMPTKIHANHKDRAHVRIDYMLANKALLEYVPEAHIIHDEDISATSDHYPIECHIKG